ncbi:putative LysE/RhtB family amino acid efflux pump [Candidatus Moduliflexus flocculans]|uniref:Putative LysE/RhtB family amino acid efflux pump n=1 Tax=Candidatus Moduliflexus flocculans TaxID=1499966 RepID=A0A0S6W3L0_9BACT|nr:putative LysE/RhtB family amino acid efflux pump [Candidatus Moduliflexus flocculans]
MDIHLFGKGLIIGFSIAAPVGPIGLLCIQRSISGGWLLGLISGLGAASADAIYGVIAAFGVTAVSSLLLEQQLWFRLIGGAFLCYLGVRTFLSKPAEQRAEDAKSAHPLRAYASVLLLTITNPITILAFAAIFAGIGVGGASGSYGSAALMVAGVFSGSMLWWTLLSSTVGLLHGRLRPQHLRWINCASGVVLVGFGAVALLTLWR